MLLKDYYSDFRNHYSDFTNTNREVTKRKASARFILDDMVYGIFNDPDILDIVKNQSDYNEKKYQGYTKKFHFLIKNRTIPRKHQSAFEEVWKECSIYGHHNYFGKGVDNSAKIHLSLNQILTWFYEINDKKEDLRFITIPELRHSIISKNQKNDDRFSNSNNPDFEHEKQSSKQTIRKDSTESDTSTKNKSWLRKYFVPLLAAVSIAILLFAYFFNKNEGIKTENENLVETLYSDTPEIKSAQQSTKTPTIRKTDKNGPIETGVPVKSVEKSSQSSIANQKYPSPKQVKSNKETNNDFNTTTENSGTIINKDVGTIKEQTNINKDVGTINGQTIIKGDMNQPINQNF